MQDLFVRPVQKADLTAVLTMAQALASHHGDTAALTYDTLARDALGEAPWLTILVAEHKSALLGYAATCPRAQLQFGLRGMDIHHLFVAQDARGKGIGRRLIAEVLRTARMLHCSYVTVGTHPDNHAAAEVYHRAGFAPLPAPGPRFAVRL